ncbi:protein-glutamine gamma-glutamyltransferase [Paenibacillus doosanensis]|nr:protein-glutamine gamma-glutamyltransferase [Paenibacillus doosanensis]
MFVTDESRMKGRWIVMIVISGGGPPQGAMALTDLERAIYREMDASPTKFTYPSWDAFFFELRLRASIITAAEDLERSDVSFASFKKSRCNEAYWTRKDNGGFLLNPDVRSSEAVRDIYLNGKKYAFECATAIIIVLYKGVLDVIGDALFDKLFANLYLYSWNYDRDLRLVTQFNGAEAFGGDVQYFKNPDVNPEWIEWQGENVVRLAPDLYYGHGIGITTGERIIAKLNRLRIEGSTVSAYLMDEVTHPDFAYLYKLTTTGEPPASRPTSALAGPGQVVAAIGGRTGIYF